MRRVGTTLVRPTIGAEPKQFSKANPEMWVQIGEESWNTNIVILETIQELKNKMAKLRADSERLMK